MPTSSWNHFNLVHPGPSRIICPVYNFFVLLGLGFSILSFPQVPVVISVSLFTLPLFSHKTKRNKKSEAQCDKGFPCSCWLSESWFKLWEEVKVFCPVTHRQLIWKISILYLKQNYKLKTRFSEKSYSRDLAWNWCVQAHRYYESIFLFDLITFFMCFTLKFYFVYCAEHSW